MGFIKKNGIPNKPQKRCEVKMSVLIECYGIQVLKDGYEEGRNPLAVIVIYKIRVLMSFDDVEGFFNKILFAI